MKQRILIGLLLALPCLAQASEADSQGNIGRWFIGVGLGSVDFDDDGFSEDLEDDLNYSYGTWYSNDIDTETKDTALLLKLGYRFNRVAGIEFSYIDYGDVDYQNFGNDFIALGITSFSLAANVGYTFNNGLRPFALIGLSSVEVDAGSADDRYVGFHYGFGGEFTPSSAPAVTFRLAVEGDVFVDDSLEDDFGYDSYAMDIATAQLGVTFNF